MEDYILRITAGGGSVAAFIATTKNTVNTAAEIHRSSPVVTAALGRLLTAAAMMSLQLKNDDDLLTLNIKGDGPIGGILATSDRFARVKGYAVNNLVEIPLKKNGKLDVPRAIGSGNLHVLKDLGLKEPYAGTIPLTTGEIAEDLCQYFTVSEQTPSAIGLGVSVDTDHSVRQAGGFMIQPLPGADDMIISRLERIIGNFGSITSFYDEGKTPYDLADHFFGDIGYNVNERISMEYYCNCGRDRAERALISLGKNEIEKIIKEDGKIELHCHFCGKDYVFGDEILINIPNGK